MTVSKLLEKRRCVDLCL